MSVYSLMYSASKSIGIVLLIDSSGSMANSDPLKLRLQAAKSFIDLLNVGDQVGVIDFSTTSKVLARPTIIDRNYDKEELKKDIEIIGSNGEKTDILNALDSAYQLMKTTPGNETNRVVILLTDGKLELPNSSSYFGRQEEAIAEICEMYKKAKIRIISVGFTDNADINLLEKFEKVSGGRVYIAKKDTELLKVYIDIFADLKQLYRVFEFYSDLNLKSHDYKEIFIDKYVKELIFAINRSVQSIEIEVKGADGNIVGESNSFDLCLSEGDAYKIFRVIKPKPGKWNVYLKGLGNAYGQMICTTDLLLELKTSKNSFRLNEPIKIEAYLTLNNVRIDDPEVLNETKFNLKVRPPNSMKYDEISMVDNGTNTDSKDGDGIYSFSYAGFRKKGEYILNVEATNPGVFERKNDKKVSRGDLFEVLNQQPIDLGDVISGKNATCNLIASSDFETERVFTPILLTFTPSNNENEKDIDVPKIEPDEIKFPPSSSKDSKSYVHIKTTDLPLGKYEGKLKLIGKNLNEEIILDFKLNVIPSPPLPNPILSILFILLLILLGIGVMLITLHFYKKRLPKFSGAIIWESEGGNQQFTLIGLKKGVLGKLGIRSRRIIVGSSNSADIRIYGQGIDKEHIFLKAEKDSRGRRTNIVVYPIKKNEVWVNDDALLGCSMILKHDNVIRIGDQHLRYEDFTQGIESNIHFESSTNYILL